MAMEVATLGIRVDSTSARQELDNLTTTSNRTTQAMSSSEKAAASMGKAMSSLAGALSSLGLAAFAKGVLDTNREMESLRASLKSTMGTATAATAAFNSITEFAKSTPYEIKGLTQTFITLQNMGIKPTQQVMEALTNQASKLGGSQETLTSIALQLGQAHSKGKLQMEDMVVLMEKGVPVMDMLAKVTGKNGAELADMSAKGTITNDIIDKLIVKMGEMSTGSNANAMDTLNGKISSLSDAWHSFEDALLNDKSEGLIKKVVSNWTDWLDYFKESIAGVGEEFKALDEINGKIVQSKAKIAALSQGGAAGAAWTAVGALTSDNLAGEENRLKDLVKQRDGIIKSTHDVVVAKNQEKAATDSLLNSTTKEIKLTGETEEAKKAHEKAAKAAQKAQDSLTKSFDDALTSMKLHNDELSKTPRDHQQAELAAKGYTKAMIEQAMAVYDVGVALDKKKKVADAEKAEMDTLIDKYNQLTLSARDYYSLSLTNKGIAPDKQAPMLEQFDKNTGLEKTKKTNEDAKTTLDAYNKSLDEASQKTMELGKISSSVFDGALGGISAMAGAFDTMVSAIAGNTKQLEENSKAQALNAKTADPKEKADNYAKYAKQEAKLNNDNIKAQITGASQIAGAAASMFDKKSGAAKAFHAIEVGLSVARLAMDATEMASTFAKTAANVAAGAAAMFRDMGPLGFAGVAAMMAVMAGLGFAGGGGVHQEPPKSSPDTGSVLGDSTAKSESASKTYQLLKDIHASEYAELRGINKGVSDLQNAITGTVTKLFQSGGLDLSNKGINLSKPDYQLGAFALGLTSLMFSGGYRSVTERGISTPAQQVGNVGQNGFQAQQYNVVKTRTWDLFSDSTRYDTVMTALDSKVTESMTKIFAATGEIMTGLAKNFGGNLQDKVNQYVIPALRIDLTGLNGEDAAKKLNGVISTVLDNMAASVFGTIVGQYQKLGEGMLETAVRIVSELAVVKDTFAQAGIKLSNNAIALSDSLVQAAGGLQEFQSAFEGFFDKFYTDAQKQARTFTSLSSALGDVFLVPPTTRAGYAALFTQISTDAKNTADDLKKFTPEQQKSTVAGLKAAQAAQLASDRWTAFINSAGLADQYYSLQESNLKTLTDTVSTAKSNLLSAYKTEADVLTSVTTKMTTFSDSLKKFRDTLQTGALSILSPDQKSNVFTQRFNDIAKVINGGVGKTATDDKTVAFGNAVNALPQAAQDFLSASMARSATRQDYERDYAKVMGVVNKGITTSDNAKTVAEQSLEQLKTQVGGLIDINQSVLKVVDAIKELNKANSNLTAAENKIKNTFDTATTKNNTNITKHGLDLDSTNAASVLAQKKTIYGAWDNLARLESHGGTQYGSSYNLLKQSITGLSSFNDKLSVEQYKALDNLVSKGISAFNWVFSEQNSGTAWRNVEGNSYIGQLQAAANEIKNGKVNAKVLGTTHIAGFAAGGYHMGGLRIVGENGPELEATAPSRIFSNSQTTSMFDNSDLITEVKKLINEVVELRKDVKKGDAEDLSNAKEQIKLLKRWNVDGLPVKETDSTTPVLVRLA